MKVNSGAGQFDITVERVVTRDDAVVLVGKMGVWESETIIEPSDLWRIMRLSLRPQVLWFFLRLPLLLLRGGGRKGGQGAAEGP